MHAVARLSPPPPHPAMSTATHAITGTLPTSPMLAAFSVNRRGVGKTRQRRPTTGGQGGDKDQGGPLGGGEEGGGHAQAQPAARELPGGRQARRLDASGQGGRRRSKRGEERGQGRREDGRQGSEGCRGRRKAGRQIGRDACRCGEDERQGAGQEALTLEEALDPAGRRG